LYSRKRARKLAAQKAAEEAAAQKVETFDPETFEDFNQEALEALKVGAELKPLAAHLGIEGAEKMTGAKLVAAILEAKQDPDPDPDPESVQG